MPCEWWLVVTKRQGCRVVAARGGCGASRCRPAGDRLGRATARAGPPAARGTCPDRCVPGRRAVQRTVAGAVRRAAGSPVGAGRLAAAAAVSQALLPAGLRAPVRRGGRLDRLAAVLAPPPGPAPRAPPPPPQRA